MQSAVETTSDLGLKINISVPANELQDAYSKKLKEVAKIAEIKGFRPGKVPESYVRKIYGKSIEGEVVDSLVKSSFELVCKEHNIIVAGIEKVDVDEPVIGNDLKFSISLETFPKVEYSDSDFSNAKVEKMRVTVTSKDVDAAIEKLKKSHADWEKIEESDKAKMGDKVVIDFTAIQDGKELESGSAEDFELELGSNYLIPGFEEGVVGHRVNDEFKLSLKFPDDYHATEHAGKEAVFTVKLKEISRAKLPEVNEEFISIFGITANDGEDLLPETKDETEKKPVDLEKLVVKFKEKIKESLESEVKNQVDTRFKNSLFDALCDCKKINVPKSLIEEEITDIINHQQDRYRQQVGDKNAKLNFKRDKFKEQASKNVHIRLLVRAFIDQFGIKADREQVKTKLSSVMGGHEISDDLLNWYYTEPQRLHQIEALTLEDMVIQKLSETIAITEKDVSFDDLMKV